MNNYIECAQQESRGSASREACKLGGKNLSIDNKHIKEVCKIGQGKECCRYLLCGPDGFECAKPNIYIRNTIDARVREGTFTAQGDNCKGLKEARN
jgi:hypothetical protein